ncbi:MAG: hypothetical protein ACHQWU_13690 [Gemmatimonadales bacterium]
MTGHNPVTWGMAVMTSAAALWILADSGGTIRASASPVTDIVETAFEPAHERRVVIHWVQILGQPRPRG